jgi:hypothetical protein
MITGARKSRLEEFIVRKAWHAKEQEDKQKHASGEVQK